VNLSEAHLCEQQFTANWIVFNGTTYRPGQVLVVGVVHDMPKV
jgi:hypothetical protein